MGLMKALIPSTILTLLVAALVGYSGASEHVLQLESASIGGHEFHWSWPFFMTVMALNSLIVLIGPQRGNA